MHLSVPSFVPQGTSWAVPTHHRLTRQKGNTTNLGAVWWLQQAMPPLHQVRKAPTEE